MNYSPDRYKDLIQAALLSGDIRLVEQLAAQAAQDYPADEEMQKYGQILTPGPVVKSDLPADPTILLNQNWLDAHRLAYQGQWVVLRNGQLIGHAKSREAWHQLVQVVHNLDDRQGLFVTVVH